MQCSLTNATLLVDMLNRSKVEKAKQTYYMSRRGEIADHYRLSPNDDSVYVQRFSK